MKRAIVEDTSAKQPYHVDYLIARDGRAVLGRRDCEYAKNTISLGVGVENCLDTPIGKVSGRHAEITCNREGRYSIRDLHSKNGTELERGKERIPVPKEIAIPILDGDIIDLGGYTVIFHLQEVEKKRKDGTRTSVFE